MKKMIKIAFVAAFAAIAGYGVYANQKSEVLSDLTLANVEALARYEDGECPNGCLTEYDSKGCWCYRFYPNVKEKDWTR